MYFFSLINQNKELSNELKTEMGVHLCILETAGEQSLKNANVYEKLNALEHREGIAP